MPLASKATPPLLQDSFKLPCKCASHVLTQCNSSVCDLGTRGFLGEMWSFVASVGTKGRRWLELQSKLTLLAHGRDSISHRCQCNSQVLARGCLTAASNTTDQRYFVSTQAGGWQQSRRSSNEQLSEFPASWLRSPSKLTPPDIKVASLLLPAFGRVSPREPV